MQIKGHDIGVCSWSLRPMDMSDLVARVRQVGVEHVQLALNSLLAADDATRESELKVLRESKLQLTAGMIGFAGEDYTTIAHIRKTGGYVPDATWPQRMELTVAAGKLARQIGLAAITTHVGFIPPSSDFGYQTIVKRLGEVADALGEFNVALLMETGQETASELLQFLNDLRRKNVNVNFDPANMILYGAGDPIDAVPVLGRHIRHVHIKDAMLSDAPRAKWGNEVPFGTGQVHPGRFLEALGGAGYTGPLLIEREAGGERLREVSLAIEALRSA